MLRNYDPFFDLDLPDLGLLFLQKRLNGKGIR